MKVGLQLINVLAKLGGTNAHEEIMLARRGISTVSKSISCCISTTEAVLETYDTFTDGRLGYVPVFVNTDALNKKGRLQQRWCSLLFWQNDQLQEDRVQ